MCNYNSKKIKDWNEFDIHEWYQKIYQNKIVSTEKDKFEEYRDSNQLFRLSQLEKILLELQGVNINDRRKIRGYAATTNWYSYCINEQPRVS